MPTLKTTNTTNITQYDNKFIDENWPWYLKVNKFLRTNPILNKMKKTSPFVSIRDTCIDKDHRGFNGKTILHTQCQVIGESATNIHGTTVASVIAATPGVYFSDKKPGSGAESEHLDSNPLVVSGVVPSAYIIGFLDNQDHMTHYMQYIKSILNSSAYQAKSLSQVILMNYSGGDLEIEEKDKILTRIAKSLNITFEKWITPPRIFNSQVCEKLVENNALIISAMANRAEHLNPDGKSIIWPASIDIRKSPVCKNAIVRVAGTNKYEDNGIGINKFKKIKYSSKYTDIYSPAEEISVLIPKTPKGFEATSVGGTSQATPLIAGVIAIMSACAVGLNSSELRTKLLEYSDSTFSTLDNVALLDIHNTINKVCNTGLGSKFDLMQDEL